MDRVHVGDCRDLLAWAFEPNSVDAIVTDPPYGLSKEPDANEVLRHWLAGDDYAHRSAGFMGEKWDSFVPGPATWREALRVLKPGGYALVFAGTRTADLMAIALRLAGFEIRDTVAWVYGSGFPKSVNVSSQIARRDPEAAGKWAGWGSCLKPAFEPVIVARKPLFATIAENVLIYGTGGLNIDATRIPLADAGDAAAFANNHAVTERLPTDRAGTPLGLHDGGWKQRVGPASVPEGRFPANLIHDGSPEVLAAFPAGGEGSAARFFYCAKATRADRGEGNVHPTVKPTALMRYLVRLVARPGALVLDPFTGSGSTGKACAEEGVEFVGVEQSPEYAAIAEARIAEAYLSAKEAA